MNESENGKNVETHGNMADDLEQESLPNCECNCSSSLPTNTLNACGFQDL
jgi:hypothetical protein